ncbi:MAG TPA: winged helix-turn-helix domain-containing protein [Terracidiphilus sp.]|nr:winged helix-turn-helix domain-containing protein [Terracidiphilus sp.]
MPQRAPASAGSESSGFSFAGFRLEADGALFRGETPVHLPPKELAALQLLVANAGWIVSPTQMRHALWGDVNVTAESVPKCISSLRARLEPEDCIQTVYKRGYRLTAAVRNHADSPNGALPRLAIMPFASGLGIPDHLGSVLAEETMARLSSIRPAPVAVLAQDSVFTLARRGMTALETARALGADMVLAGSLRALPMHYRIRAEMIQVEDGTQVWVEDVLVDRHPIAGLEAELVNRLVFRLTADSPGSARTGAASHTATPPASFSNASLSAAKEAAAPHPKNRGLSLAAVADPRNDTPSVQREAYEIFQHAHYEWQTMERHRMQDGLQHLLRATELDPSLVRARVDLANLCVTQCAYGFMSSSVAADIVRAAADAIPDLATRAAAILPALGWVRFHVDRNLRAALWAFSVSAHLPHDPWTTRARCMFVLSRRRFGEAIDMLRAAIHSDPYAPWLQARLAWALHLAGETSQSVDQIQSTLRQFPDHDGTNIYGTLILASSADAAQALQLAESLAQRALHYDLASTMHAYALATLGRRDEAHAIVERLQWLGRERFLLRAFMPLVYLALDEPDAALAELHASDQNRCPWFFQVLADPRLKPLHARPEFQQMLSILDSMEAASDRDEQALA